MRRIVRAAGPWEYFVRKVRIGTPDQCWEWMGSVGGPGYGNWYCDLQGFPKQGAAHRRAYALFFGHPGKLQVNHKCGNRKCCNPDHLYAGTQKQNYEDMIDHGTHIAPPVNRGNKTNNQYGGTKLDEEKVREIRLRKENGEAGRSLAIEYGVSEHVICKVWTRKNWGWVN